MEGQNGTLPIILSIPHGGLGVPPEIAGRLAVGERALYNECDLWAELLYDFAATPFPRPDTQYPTTGTQSPTSNLQSLSVLAAVTAPIARALIDVNRAPGNLDHPDGAVKSQTSYGEQIYSVPLTAEEKVALGAAYWAPYHAALAGALRAHAGQVRLFLDCHNMAQTGPRTYAHPGAARPFVCLANFGDAQGEPPEPGARLSCPPALLRRAGEIAAALFADMTLLEPVPGVTPPVVALNWPFPGGYLLDRYTQGWPQAPLREGSTPTPDAAHEADPSRKGDHADAGFPRAPLGIMIEVNRGLFVGNQTEHTPVAPPNLERIAAVRERLRAWVTAIAAEMRD